MSTFSTLISSRLSASEPVATAGLAALSVYLAYVLQKAVKKFLLKTPPLPPGPRGLPIVGNAFDVPPENFWEKYKGWSDEYCSDVIHIKVFGADMIILNSLEACKELLDKRSSIYSSRPDMPMMNDLLGYDWHFAFMPYDDAWKERRRIFQQGFQASKVVSYRPKLHKAVNKFLLNLLEDPANFRGHERLLAGSFILDVGYGIEVDSMEDMYIQQAERGLIAMAHAGTLSRYLVDFIPSLKYVPSWMPGAQFKRDAKLWRPDVKGLVNIPFEYLVDAMRRGDAAPCLATELLQELDADDPQYAEKKRAIQDVLGTMYAAGSDTTVATASTFFLTMIQNPEIFKKAQRVVDDAMTQLGRIPGLEDWKDLPYIEAVVREILRWRPVTPIAVPHKVTEDDIYRGYHIPAGASIIPNVYAITHDSSIYGANPEKFNPSRFMNASQTEINPEMPMGHDTFGYGRRVCPGLQVAVESIWLVVVSVLAVFDLNAVGKEREGFVRYNSGLLIHPDPYEVDIKPRSQEAVDMIKHNSVSAM